MPFCYVHIKRNAFAPRNLTHKAHPEPLSCHRIKAPCILTTQQPPLWNLGIKAVTIAPTSGKRKAAEAKITSTSTPTEPGPKKRIVASAASEPAPPTPVTTNEMDSEEDFLSAASSEDEIGRDDTDNDMMSEGGGECSSSDFDYCCSLWHDACCRVQAVVMWGRNH